MNTANKIKLVKLVNHNYPLILSEQELYNPDRRKATGATQPKRYKRYCKCCKVIGKLTDSILRFIFRIDHY